MFSLVVWLLDYVENVTKKWNDSNSLSQGLLYVNNTADFWDGTEFIWYVHIQTINIENCSEIPNINKNVMQIFFLALSALIVQ